MTKSHNPLNLLSQLFFKQSFKRSIFAIIFLLISDFAVALVNNPANLTCSTNSLRGSLADADYNALMSSYDSGIANGKTKTSDFVDINVDSTNKFSMKMSKKEQNITTFALNVNKFKNYHSFFINQIDGAPGASNTITFSFLISKPESPFF